MSNSTANAATTHATGGTALRGRIEAIGVFDLLRIAVTKGNTGRLLVFNDQFDAELYYVSGRLVAAAASSSKGRDALKEVLQMTEGEFEFAAGHELAPAQHDTALHDVMMNAIKSHYQERVRARQDSTASMAAVKSGQDVSGGVPATKSGHDSTANMPEVRTSGLHRTKDNSRVAVAPIVSIEQAEQTVSNSGVAPSKASKAQESAELLKGERGRAIVDGAGRITTKIGNPLPQEAALAALALKTAQSLASILGMRDLQRFEIVGANDRALMCQVAKDGIHLSAINTEVDLDALWRELGNEIR